MKKISIVLILTLSTIISIFGQKLQEGEKQWSSEQKLTLEDFKIKINDGNDYVVLCQFMISHTIKGFDFMKRNFNQKIENTFLGNASWIDTTNMLDAKKQLEFAQMQFDLAEIYARKFRKRVLENRRTIIKGFDVIEQINNDIMAEFAKSRLELTREIESAQNELKLETWKTKIATELEELYEFRYENKKKISLNQ